MITNKQGIYQIKGLFSKGQIAKTQFLFDRWTYTEIMKYRSSLIKQKWEQGSYINPLNFQEICVHLEESDISECDFNIDVEDLEFCTIYKSKMLLPKSIIPYTFVTNMDNSRDYTFVASENSRFKRHTRFKKLNDQGFYYTLDQGKGDYLFLISPNVNLKLVKVKAIFEDPLEAQTYPDDNGDIPFPCREYYDYEMKIDQGLFATVQQMIVSTYGNLILGAPDDLISNDVATV